MTVISEIAPDTYRISIYVPEIDFQFNHMLIRDDEPLLFATGSRAMFPLMREAVATLIDPTQLRWIGFGHFEGDECGSLNQWLELAPRAQPVCGYLGGLLNINDFALRPARTLASDDVLTTGKYRYRFCPTPHLPHGWELGGALRGDRAHAALLGSVLPQRECRAADQRQPGRADTRGDALAGGRPAGGRDPLHRTDQAPAVRPG